MSEETGKGSKAAGVMFAYALVMIVAGVIAFLLAPEGAKATTALAVPAACGAVMIVCGLLARSGRGGIRATGVYLGLVFALLFAAVIGMRATKTHEAVVAHQEVAETWDSTIGAMGDADPAIKKAFFDAADAPDHDKSYLRNTLGFLTVASVLAAGGILLRRKP